MANPLRVTGSFSKFLQPRPDNVVVSAERNPPSLLPQGDVEKKPAVDGWHEASEADIHVHIVRVYVCVGM